MEGIVRITNSRSSKRAIMSNTGLSNRILIIDIAAIKESIEVEKVKWIDSRNR